MEKQTGKNLQMAAEHNEHISRNTNQQQVVCQRCRAEGYDANGRNCVFCKGLQKK